MITFGFFKQTVTSKRRKFDYSYFQVINIYKKNLLIQLLCKKNLNVIVKKKMYSVVGLVFTNLLHLLHFFKL